MLLVDKQKFRKEILTRYDDNYAACAKALGIGSVHLHKFLTKKSNAGPLLMGALYEYCQREGLLFDDFIFLDKPSTALYTGIERRRVTCKSS